MQSIDINGYDQSSLIAYQAQQKSSQFSFREVAATSEKRAPAFEQSNFGVHTKAGVPQTNNTSQANARATNGNGDPVRGQFVDIFA